MNTKLLILLVFLSWAQPTLPKKLPSWFNMCKESDRILKICLKKLFFFFFPQLPAGIDILNIPPAEPLVVPTVSIQEDGPNAKYIIKLRDLKVYGVSTYTVKSIRITREENRMIAELDMPIVKLAGDYEVEGRISDYNIEGEGKFYTNFTKFHTNLLVEVDIAEENGDEIFSIKNSQAEIQMEVAKGFLTNRMKGDKKKYHNTNSFLRTHALEIVRELRPAVEMAIAITASDIGNKIPTFSPYGRFAGKR